MNEGHSSRRLFARVGIVFIPFPVGSVRKAHMISQWLCWSSLGSTWKPLWILNENRMCVNPHITHQESLFQVIPRMHSFPERCYLFMNYIFQTCSWKIKRLNLERLHPFVKYHDKTWVLAEGKHLDVFLEKAIASSPENFFCRGNIKPMEVAQFLSEARFILSRMVHPIIRPFAPAP